MNNLFKTTGGSITAIFAIAVIAYFIFRKGEKQVDSKITSPNPPKSPERELTAGDLTRIYEDLKDCKGTFNDDEEGVYAILGKVPTITDGWMLNFMFKKLDGLELKDWLSSFLNQEELNRCVTIINGWRKQ